MYTEYWNLAEKPFENTPDPRFLYLSDEHEEAIMRMLYAVQEKKGAAMLTGEYGTGKTLLSRAIAERLLGEEDKYNVAMIVNPTIPSVELLFEIVYQLGGKPSKDNNKSEILRMLNEMLYKTIDEKRHTVVVIDEAQAIKDDDIFEELRLLLNFQFNDRFLLTLLLLGQPELREKVNRIKQLHQRISIIYHLVALGELDTVKYIEHRLRVAGSAEVFFTDRAYKLIYERSKGMPRVINNICDMALVIGFGEKAKVMDENIVSEVSKDFLIKEQQTLT